MNHSFLWTSIPRAIVGNGHNMKNWKKRFIAFITCIVFSIVSLPIVSAAEKIDNNSDKEIIALSQLPMVLSEGDTQREIEMIDTLAKVLL